jgi:hypothetical protein
MRMGTTTASTVGTKLLLNIPLLVRQLTFVFSVGRCAVSCSESRAVGRAMTAAGAWESARENQRGIESVCSAVHCHASC